MVEPFLSVSHRFDPFWRSWETLPTTCYSSVKSVNPSIHSTASTDSPVSNSTGGSRATYKQVQGGIYSPGYTSHHGTGAYIAQGIPPTMVLRG